MQWRVECYDCESMCEISMDSQPEFCPCCGIDLDPDNIVKLEEVMDIDSYEEDLS